MTLSGVVLVLALLNPDLTIRAHSIVMPSQAACEAAGRAFLDGEPDARTIKDTATRTRWAHCVTLPSTGRDA